mgnify:CR=1 FL=1
MEEFRIDMRKPEEADPAEGIRCVGERVVHGQYRREQPCDAARDRSTR